MAELNYTVNKDDLESSFEAIPAGEYLAVITGSDLVPTKNNDGMMLKLTYQILDGPMKGKKIFENLNLQNKNPQAEQIARKSLNSIGVACGLTSMIKDSAQLHDIPLKLDVTVKDSDQYGKQNSIRKHISVTPAVSGSVAQTAEQAPGKAKKHAWEK